MIVLNCLVLGAPDVQELQLSKLVDNKTLCSSANILQLNKESIKILQLLLSHLYPDDFQEGGKRLDNCRCYMALAHEYFANFACFV